MFQVSVEAKPQGKDTIYSALVKRKDPQDGTLTDRYPKSKIKNRAINSVQADVWSEIKKGLLNGRTVTITVD